MIGKKRKPRIPGLVAIGFVEKVVPTGVGYTTADLAVVAVPTGKKEFDAYAVAFRQIPGATVTSVVFGSVTGWQITQGPGVGYVLQADGQFTLINVDSLAQRRVDAAQVESCLHTLTFV
jgi:hypothetical protein